MTMESLDEYATLKALGASKAFIVRTVLSAAMILATAGCLLGLVAAVPLVQAASNVIAWIYTPWWLPAAIVPPTFLMCGLAAVVSVRAALTVDPARVFRA
jgi:putative ABC transport system permease protein